MKTYYYIILVSLILPQHIYYALLPLDHHVMSFDDVITNVNLTKYQYREALENQSFVMLKLLPNEDEDGFDLYVGGRNALYRFPNLDINSKPVSFANYSWTRDDSLMNGTTAGIMHNEDNIYALNFDLKRKYVMAQCLNYITERWGNYDYGAEHGSPNGKNYFIALDSRIYRDFICFNSFIKAVEVIGTGRNKKLWVCGTFGTFPRAFELDFEMNFLGFSDKNLMSCASYIDEPVATLVSKETGDLYVGSGWGFYKPAKRHPDSPYNNSTMLYSDWRMFHNDFHWPTHMAMTLGSDVNFIPVIKETKDYIYAFGREINPQYSYINMQNRDAWSSFMLRICKNDPGFNYTAMEGPNSDYIKAENLQDPALEGRYYKENNETLISLERDNYWKFLRWGYNMSILAELYHLPMRHFTTAVKFPLGCYLQRHQHAVGTNYFGGDTNVVYFNRLVDGLFDPDNLRNNSYDHRDYYADSSCTLMQFEKTRPFVGLYNSPGMGTVVKATGAICHHNIDDWKQHETKEGNWNDYSLFTEDTFLNTNINNKRMYEDPHDAWFSLFASHQGSFYSRDYRRTEGNTPAPFWGMGVQMVRPSEDPDYRFARDNLGICKGPTLTRDKFLLLTNYSSFTWPTDFDITGNAEFIRTCHNNPTEVMGRNPTFILEGVEFKKILEVKGNITDYWSRHEEPRDPLMYVIVVSTTGSLYRVVMCDFQVRKLNWNMCKFNQTDQPMLVRNLGPGQIVGPEVYEFPASSLLSEWTLTSEADINLFPNNQESMFHLVKDAFIKDNYVYVTTIHRLMRVKAVECSLYDTCVHCASDPFCMWNSGKKRCDPFDARRIPENLFKCMDTEMFIEHPRFIQDVQSRGSLCTCLLPRRLTEVQKVQVIVKYITEGTMAVRLTCPNKAYWRGSIRWYKNRVVLNADSQSTADRFFISPRGQDLVVLDALKDLGNYTCRGERYFTSRIDPIPRRKLLARYQLVDATGREDMETIVCANDQPDKAQLPVNCRGLNDTIAAQPHARSSSLICHPLYSLICLCFVCIRLLH